MRFIFRKTDKNASPPVQHPPPVLPASSTTRPSTRRLSTRITDSPSLIHRYTQSSVTTPGMAVNPFNDLNDNGKGHKLADDINLHEQSVPNKSVHGLSDNVSNTLSNPDREGSV